MAAACGAGLALTALTMGDGPPLSMPPSPPYWTDDAGAPGCRSQARLMVTWEMLDEDALPRGTTCLRRGGELDLGMWEIYGSEPTTTPPERLSVVAARSARPLALYRVVARTTGPALVRFSASLTPGGGARPWSLWVEVVP